MSINVVNLLEIIAALAAGAIALLAVYRSLTIGKSLVSRVYRTRAYWLAVLMTIYAAFAFDPGASAIESDISGILFFMFLFGLLIFIDSNVAVAREIDFFHRDILHWRAARTPLFAIVVVGSAIGIWSIFALSSNASIISGAAFLGFFILLGVVFAYSGAAMFLIARSTYDRTMKKFVKMLGFAILSYVLFLTLFIPLDAIYPQLGDVVTSFIAIAAAYFFYNATMSLSNVGQIEREVVSP
jgi:hypothetical protein